MRGNFLPLLVESLKQLAANVMAAKAVAAAADWKLVARGTWHGAETETETVHG